MKRRSIDDEKARAWLDPRFTPRSFWILVFILAMFTPAAHAEEKSGRFNFFGDFRFRMEQDWDSLQGDGTQREDRLRARIRLRLGFDVSLSDEWSILVQARTGPHLSQQSPHITIYDFDDGPDGPYEGSFDHWFAQYESGGLEFWIGRNELSFWHQDDLFVFDNITYAGVGGAYHHSAGQGDLIWNLNFVTLPVGMQDFAGRAAIGQMAYEREFSDSGITIAGGIFASNADPDDPAGDILLTENNTRDYRILDLEFQYRSKMFSNPYTIGLALTHNFKNYHNDSAGSFSQFHQDDINGFAIEFEWGERVNAGDWQLGFFYLYHEALAVNSSYTQDDWVRWGNANQVRATNLKGIELRAVYTIRPNMNIFARVFFVDAIDLLEPGDTTRETGNRFRIDYNISF
jgi:hypothetical protein